MNIQAPGSDGCASRSSKSMPTFIDRSRLASIDAWAVALRSPTPLARSKPRLNPSLVVKLRFKSRLNVSACAALSQARPSADGLSPSPLASCCTRSWAEPKLALPDKPPVSGLITLLSMVWTTSMIWPSESFSSGTSTPLKLTENCPIACNWSSTCCGPTRRKSSTVWPSPADAVIETPVGCDTSAQVRVSSAPARSMKSRPAPRAEALADSLSTTSSLAGLPPTEMSTLSASDGPRSPSRSLPSPPGSRRSTLKNTSLSTAICSAVTSRSRKPNRPCACALPLSAILRTSSSLSEPEVSTKKPLASMPSLRFTTTSALTSIRPLRPI